MAQAPPEIPRGHSLEDVHRSVRTDGRHWWWRLFAFTGPAYLVSVGYMDPGNWATDIEGGSKFGYQLLWVLLMSNAMAVVLQTLSARLGLVTGRDLAQACHDEYPPLVNYALFGLCEIAIAACDLAEVLGSAIGVNLLFPAIPLSWAVILTSGDVLLLLAMQHFGVRKMEALILMLISTIGLCFVFELFLCKPSLGGIAAGFIPRLHGGEQLFVAIGIIGATVMPHNLYLHSALVQSRDVTRSRQAVAEACKFNLIDSAVAMNCAFLVNAAILIVAAATFWHRQEITDLGQAHEMIKNLLGSRFAPFAFAVALICAGQSSTITGTLAGQITMEGFLRFRIRAWLRRLITRCMAIVPAVLVILYVGEHGVYQLLILSQVVLALQLSFAVVPLVKFTDSKQKMGPFANRPWVRGIAWLTALIVLGLDLELVREQVRDWADAAGRNAWMVYAGATPVLIALGLLLLWIILHRERPMRAPATVSAEEVAAAATNVARRFRRIGVALEALPSDSAMLAEAIALAKQHHAELLLMHVVDGVGGHWYGPQTGDLESRTDEAYLNGLAARLRTELACHGVPKVEVALGYGNPPREIANLSRQHDLDLVVLGGHGHRPVLDLLHGETISGVRHGVNIPVLTVR